MMEPWGCCSVSPLFTWHLDIGAPLVRSEIQQERETHEPQAFAAGATARLMRDLTPRPGHGDKAQRFNCDGRMDLRQPACFTAQGLSARRSMPEPERLMQSACRPKADTFLQNWARDWATLKLVVDAVQPLPDCLCPISVCDCCPGRKHRRVYQWSFIRRRCDIATSKKPYRRRSLSFWVAFCDAFGMQSRQVSSRVRCR